MKRRDDPNQALINWNDPAAAGTPPPSPFPDPVKLAGQKPPPLVERLPWDFATTFPQPTQEAIDAGRLSEEDCSDENIESLHDEHARELLSILQDRDAILDARRRGVDPLTGKTPRTQASGERLKRLFETEPDRLNRAFNSSMEVYEEVFGPEAAHAFHRFIVARHAGIPVEIDHAAEPEVVRPRSEQSPTDRVKRRRHPGSSCLPVPRPLPEAIKDGHFGTDEGGNPIAPRAEEVRGITEQHAEKIIALLDELKQMERSLTAPQCSDRARAGAEVQRLKDQVQGAVAQYAGSFGERAAAQLERYVRSRERDL